MAIDLVEHCIDDVYLLTDKKNKSYALDCEIVDSENNESVMLEDYLLLYTGAVLKRVSNAVEFFMDEDVPVIPEVGKEETE